jgi:hypothetical protein
MRFFQLNEYQTFHREAIITTDFQEAFGVNLLLPTTIRSLVDRMETDHALYSRYLVARLGYRNSAISFTDVSNDALKIFLNRFLSQSYICSMKFYDVEDYTECVKAQGPKETNLFLE